MPQKFIGTIFELRKTEIPKHIKMVSEFRTIKPAMDIADFEYPAESSFYRESPDYLQDQ